MNLALIGVNFRTASVEVREKISFASTKVSEVLKALIEKLPGTEIAVLSTCNRTELYISSNDLANKTDDILHVFLEIAGAGEMEGVSENFYVKHNMEAVEHLVSVASSLDSMVVGETEILGQIKQAYVLAADLQPECKMLHSLFQTAIRAAKRVHSETDICRGRVSVSSLAVEFAEKVFHDLASKTIMLIGAGETGELALKSLVGKGVKEVLVFNRSIERSEAIAEQHGGRAIQYDLFGDYLSHADVVISSTAAPHCVITAESVEQAVSERHGRPVLFLDIAVPRDIEEGVGELENVYLCNIDDLQKVAAENLTKRQDAVDHAWVIVREEALELSNKFDSVSLGSVMQMLDKYVKNIEADEFERSFSKQKLASIPTESRDEVCAMVRRITAKLLASPRKSLSDASRNGHWEEYTKVITDLFDFEQKSNENQSTTEHDKKD